MKIELSEFDRSSTLMRGIMDRFRKVIYQEFIKKAKQNPSVITTNHATIQCYESDKDYIGGTLIVAFIGGSAAVFVILRV